MSNPAAADAGHSNVPQPLVLVAIAICAGIIADRYLSQTIAVYCVLFIVGFSGWWITYRLQRDLAATTMLLVAWLSLAAFWHHVHWNWFPKNGIQSWTQRDSCPAGVRVQLMSEPQVIALDRPEDGAEQRSETRTQMKVRVIEIRNGLNWIPSSGLARLVVHGDCPNLNGKDTVQVWGRLVCADAPRNPGQFNFRSYGRAKQQLVTIHVYATESIERIGRARGISSVRFRSWFRQQMDAKIWKHVGNDSGPFASAILLGNRQQLSPDRRLRFMTTGTSHLLAISGLHIGVLAGVFFVLYRVGWLVRSSTLWLTMGFVLAYSWLVEFRPPVLRATVLIILFCLARLIGRKGFSYNLLALAGIVILAINPCELFQVGTQFSFLAVATLIHGQHLWFAKQDHEPLTKLIRATRSTPVRIARWAFEKTHATVVCGTMIWMVSFPLVAHHFHLFSPVALVINPLAMVAVALALYAGLGVLMFAWVMPSVADGFGWLCHQALQWTESMIVYADRVPVGHVWTAGPAAWAVFIYFGIVLVLGVCSNRYRMARIWGALVLVWTVTCWWGPETFQLWQRSCNQELEVVFVDAGHGGSVIMKLPDGQNVVYDAGCLGSARYGASNICSVLWASRIRQIDALVISHADIDHFNSVATIAERFRVRRVYVSPVMKRDTSPSVKRLLAFLRQRQIPVMELWEGQEFEFATNGIDFQVLGPPEAVCCDNDNSNSIVLVLRAFGASVLLPGDLEDEGLHRLLEKNPEPFDVIMAPHHGSLNSCPRSVAEWATPRHVVISASSRKVKAKAVSQYASLGASVWMTGEHGAIRCKISPRQLEMQSWIRHPFAHRDYYRDRGFNRSQVLRLP